MSATPSVIADGLPIFPLHVKGLCYDKAGYLRCEIKSDSGIVDVEVRREFLYCRGTQETIIANGLVKPEWLPGLPGNGYTANTVVFDDNGPRVVVGKVRGIQKLPRIHIRAWGYVSRTVEVRLPMTAEQLEQVAALKAMEEEAQEHVMPPISHVSPQYRIQGNVIHLSQFNRPRLTVAT